MGGDSCSKGETPVWIMAIAGYCVEFGSTLSVVIATILELPVSTTHCQVGAVVFVGTAAFGPRNVAWGLFIKIAIAWVVTVPLSAVISGALTAAFRQAVN